jgi:hypothetical protein
VIAAYILIQTPSRQGAHRGCGAPGPAGRLADGEPGRAYDVIAPAKALDIDQLAKLVASRVRALDGVTRTMSCPVVHP